MICFHKFTFLESGQVIRLAREALVDQRKDQAQDEHIDRNRRTITQLEAYKAEAIHVRRQGLAGVDGSPLGHDPDQNELLDRAKHR